MGSKLSRQVAERAILITELSGNLGQGTMVKEDRTKGFVASMHGLGGVSEEVVVECVVHGATSKVVIEFFAGSTSRGYGKARGLEKTQEGRRV